MTKDSSLYEQLGQIKMRNNIQKLAFFDLFANSKACLSTCIKLARYVFSTCRNWDNYDSNESDNNNIASGLNNNDDDQNIGEKSPDNPYKLYGMYD